jgi:hypothetical protein
MSTSAESILNAGVFYFEDAGQELLELDRAQWCSHPAAVCITPDVLAVTMEHGVWRALNDRLDLLFDLFEEQELSGDQLPAVAEAIETLTAQYADVERVEAVAAVTEEGAPVKAVVSGAELVEQMQRVAAFLRHAATAGKLVIASF